ncbi:MAG: divergent PAP2 family protein [Clostridia bacterium]|nr:divergent PAP2 family protein [Clostridia bacterium]
MQHLHDFITNAAIVVPTVSWLTAQILKAIIDAAVNKTFRVSRLFGDGGMPSGHSATVMSLATIVGLTDPAGFAGMPFAIAMMFAIVVMHDATGVRREAGKQARMILSMLDVLSDYIAEKDTKIKDEKLKVLVGHTPLQVLCGALLGVAIAIGYYFAFVKI